MTSNKSVASFDEEKGEDQLNRVDVLEDGIEASRRKRSEGAGRGMKRQTFEVDLSKLQGEGDFPCPKCGVVISPDDESEQTYTVIDTKGDEEFVEEVVIQCGKCGSIIDLKGFEKLEEVASSSSIEISEPQSGSRFGYSTTHSISVDGKVAGRLTIEYLQADDVKAFSKIHRDLKVGDPFQARIFIDSSLGTSVDEIGSEGLAEIVKALKRRARSLRDRDIFIVSVEDGRERLIGRAESVIQGVTSSPLENSSGSGYG